MWIVFAKTPRPDAAHFPGRQLLAALDAIAWPLFWFLAVSAIPYNTGVVGDVVKVLLILGAARRCYRAVARNERYRFTTARWGVPILGLLAFGALLRLVA